MEYPIISFPENYNYGFAIIFILGLIILTRWYFTNKLKKSISKDKLRELSNRSGWKTWVKMGFLFLGALFIYIGLLGPKWGYQEIIEYERTIDVVALIDVSRSMSVEDVKPNRLERAKLKVNDLIDLASKKGEYRIGLTVFAGSSFIYCPLTKDYTNLKTFIRNINHSMVSEHGTDLTQGLKTALSAFHKDQRQEQKVILVFTDGESHERNIIQMAEQARNSGVIIHTIGVGTPNGELVPIKDDQGKIIDYLKDETGNIIISKLDQKTLIEIADITGGNYLTSSLGQSDFETIIQELDQLSKKNNQSRIISSKKDRFQIFALCALFFLTFELMFNSRKLMRKKI